MDAVMSILLTGNEVWRLSFLEKWFNSVDEMLFCRIQRVS